MTWEVPAEIDPFNTTSRGLFGCLVEMSYFLRAEFPIVWEHQYGGKV